MVLLILLSSIQPVWVWAKTLSLPEAILLALRYNPNIRNANLDRTVDKFSLRQAENEFALQYELTSGLTQHWDKTTNSTQIAHSYDLSPTVKKKTALGTEVSLAVKHSLSDQHDGRGVQYNPNASITVKQPLLRGFGKAVAQADLQNAYIDNEISKYTLKSQVIEQINAVAGRYFDLVEEQRKQQAVEKAWQDAQNNLTNIEAQIRVGKQAPNDIVQPRAQLAARRLTVTKAKNAVFNAKQDMLKAVGLLGDQTIDVMNELPVGNITLPDLQKSLAIALTHNIEYQKRGLAFNKIQRNYVVAQNRARWQVDLVANTMVGKAALGQEQTRAVGLELNVPVNDMGLKAAVLAAKVAVQKEELLLKQAKRDLMLEVRRQINALATNKQLIEQAKMAEELAVRSLALGVTKQHYGLLTTLDITNLINALAEARTQTIESQIGFLRARNDYWQVLGITLDEWQIQLVY
jgi:outer membrane protein TolC